jgi:hypothetical protein
MSKAPAGPRDGSASDKVEVDLLSQGLTPGDIAWYRSVGVENTDCMLALLNGFLSKRDIENFASYQVVTAETMLKLQGAGWDHIDVRWVKEAGAQQDEKTLIDYAEAGLDGWTVSTLWKAELHTVEEMTAVVKAGIPGSSVELYRRAGIEGGAKELVRCDWQCETSGVHPHVIGALQERCRRALGEKLAGEILEVWCAPRYTIEAAEGNSELIEKLDSITDKQIYQALIQLCEEHGPELTAENVNSYLYVFGIT